jgi:hypothetical protein
VTIAACCGVAATAAARVFAGGSCPGYDPPSYASTCSGLVASLSTRLGVVVGCVTLFAGMLNAGLRRTAEEIEHRRRAARSIDRGTRPSVDR